ncbi:MAG: dihydropteroate synthase [Sphingobacteriaceae bacterium]|nr:dihydropteroate synthase [Sphingobacteriaceae bacterium]
MRGKDTAFNTKKSLNLFGNLIDLSSPCIMAILNLTPDSFFSNSRTESIEKAVIKTDIFLSEGAKIIDLGAYSSRPGAVDITEEEELKRLLPVLKTLVKEFPNALFSVDTFRAEVAQQAVNCGAHIINDISAGSLDKSMFQTIAQLQVPYIMMHIKGSPQNMQQNTTYENVVTDVLNYFDEKINQLNKLGIKDLIIDPGFGFAKTTEQNYTLLNHLESFKSLEKPILVGISRKSMIYKTLETDAENALNGTSILNTIALQKGANILRVHDVKEAIECVKLMNKLKGG